jgi:hypothetical protein
MRRSSQDLTSAFAKTKTFAELVAHYGATERGLKARARPSRLVWRGLKSRARQCSNVSALLARLTLSQTALTRHGITATKDLKREEGKGGKWV